MQRSCHLDLQVTAEYYTNLYVLAGVCISFFSSNFDLNLSYQLFSSICVLLFVSGNWKLLVFLLKRTFGRCQEEVWS